MILPLLIVAAATVPDDQWLVGAWGAGPARCARDSGIRFETDGTYNSPAGEGVWELAGDRLHVSGTSGDDYGRSETVWLRTWSPAEMNMEWADGTRVTYHRCAGSGG
jgi:hypothetical protein